MKITSVIASLILAAALLAGQAGTAQAADLPAAIENVHTNAAGLAPWGLNRIDQRTKPVTAKGTYFYAHTGKGVNVYVIDSGIRTTHQDFTGRASLDVDFSGSSTAGDCMGHGTAVAGIIGGLTYGVAKRVRLHSVRVFGCTGGADPEVIATAIDWVTAHAVHPAVINLSLTAGGGAGGNQRRGSASRRLRHHRRGRGR